MVSGWQVYDNKGRVVEKYEPFFATGCDYAPPPDAAARARRRRCTTTRAARLIRTVNPDGSEQRVVLGVPGRPRRPGRVRAHPVGDYTYDANDNAGRTHAATADGVPRPLEHAGQRRGRRARPHGRRPSPATAHDRRPTGSSPAPTYDIRGNLARRHRPARPRPAFRYLYDLADRRWRMDSIDAGRRDTVLDAAGDRSRAATARARSTLSAFDVLHRPIRLWARDDAGGPVTLRERIEYGDGGDPDQPPADRDAARARNLLGRAGARTTTRPGW